jgi:hypothetical protein
MVGLAVVTAVAVLVGSARSMISGQVDAAGVVASVAPARRAARLNMLDAIASE